MSTEPQQDLDAQSAQTADVRERKETRMQFCNRHAGWFAVLPRRRKIDCMLMGGPGGWSPGCAGGTCRLWPGRDLFMPEVCRGELPLDWTTP